MRMPLADGFTSPGQRYTLVSPATYGQRRVLVYADVLVLTLAVFQFSVLEGHQAWELGMPSGALGNRTSLLSSLYMVQPSCICLRLLRQPAAGLLILARARTGSMKLASRHKMPITTSSSMRVSALLGNTGWVPPF